jgi:hypothetical protein
MKITGNITFNYKTEKDAKLIFDSLDIDNEDYLDSKLSDNEVDYNITSDKLGSFLATADDLIASEIVSEKIIRNTRKSG